MSDTERERLIQILNDRHDLVKGDDGFLVFWPTSNQGAFSAHHLRCIADEMDRVNAPWEAQIEEYMNAQDEDRGGCDCAALMAGNAPPHHPTCPMA